eukprot:COSAG01_NODE_7177_length_3317_cov_167.285270_1_plen_60_part_10
MYVAGGSPHTPLQQLCAALDIWCLDIVQQKFPWRLMRSLRGVCYQASPILLQVIPRIQLR